MGGGQSTTPYPTPTRVAHKHPNLQAHFILAPIRRTKSMVAPIVARIRIVFEMHPLRYGVSDHSSLYPIFDTGRITSVRYAYPIRVRWGRHI